MALLLILFLFLLSRILSQITFTYREAYLKAAIIFGVLTVVITEFFSLFHALMFEPVTLVWSLVNVFLLFALLKKKEVGKIPVLPLATFSILEILLILGFSSIALIIAFIALASVPNTWDSMTYHLPRVMHWIQNHTLAPYTTSISRQIAYCPFAEFTILQTIILTGCDRLAPLVQWISMVGSWVAVSLIADYFKANRLQKLFSVFMVATIPMGIMQGSSTQTDYVATFWICSFVYLAFRIHEEFSLRNILWGAACLGLALLTKGYSYVYCFPFVLLLFIRNFSDPKRRGPLLLMLVLAILLNSGYFLRNWQAFGSLFGPTDDTVNSHWNIIENAGKNIMVQVQASFHKDEDYTGNLLHMGLMVVTFFIWVFAFRKDDRLRKYLFCLWGIGVLFVLTINWQPWVTRFHLPLFVLACPWMGVIWGRLNSAISLAAISLLLYIGAQPWLWTGSPRPILGGQSFLKESREEQYFHKRTNLQSSYKATADQIKASQCRQVGLWIGGDDWEYPWWVLLKGIRLEHVQGKPAYPLGDFKPCAIIGPAVHSQLDYQGHIYYRQDTSSLWAVFREKTP